VATGVARASFGVTMATPGHFSDTALITKLHLSLIYYLKKSSTISDTDVIRELGGPSSPGSSLAPDILVSRDIEKKV